MSYSPTVKISSWATRATISSVCPVAFALATAAGLGGCAKGPDAPTASPPPPSLTLSSRAPVDFAFDSLDDRPVDSEATRGKPTVIAFVTTASLAAQAQLDFLVAMAKHDGDRVSYAAVVLEARELREIVELYRKSLAIPFPVAMADARTLVGDGPFGDVRAVPVVVMLDRQGRLAWRNDGRVAKSDELRAAMAGL